MKSLPLLSICLAAIASPALAGDRKVSSAKVVVFTQLFNEVDTDGNELLDEEEFGASYGASERPVITEIRFNELATFGKGMARSIIHGSRGIELEDFIYANGGRKITPSKFEIFQAADDNRNGFLNLSEFFATRISSATTEASGSKAFEKLDKNDDNQLSPAEFGVRTIPV